VSTLEDRLRDAYRAAAETVRPDTVVLRPARPRPDHGRGQAGRPARRRSPSRWLIPVAAAAALIAVVAAVAVLLPRAAPRPGAGRTTPDFFVVLNYRQHPSLFVVNATTGAQGARVGLPFRPADLDAVATPDGRTFVVAATQPGRCRTALYRFRLSADGTPTALTAFRTVPGIVQDPWAMAVSGNGQVVAYYSLVCGQSARVKAPRAFLAVVNAVTGQAKQWTFENVSGSGTLNLSGSPYARASGFGSLSISADGRVVGYGFRVLDADAAPGSLAARSRVVAQAGPFPSLTIPVGLDIAQDGTTAYTGVFFLGASHGVHLQLRSVDLATGQARIVRDFPETLGPLAGLTFDPTRRYLLAQSWPGTTPIRLARLDLATGRVTWLNADWAIDPAIAW
jgi:hypothetical protein